MADSIEVRDSDEGCRELSIVDDGRDEIGLTDQSSGFGLPLKRIVRMMG